MIHLQLSRQFINAQLSTSHEDHPHAPARRRRGGGGFNTTASLKTPIATDHTSRKLSRSPTYCYNLFQPCPGHPAISLNINISFTTCLQFVNSQHKTVLNYLMSSDSQQTRRQKHAKETAVLPPKENPCGGSKHHEVQPPQPRQQQRIRSAGHGTTHNPHQLAHATSRLGPGSYPCCNPGGNPAMGSGFSTTLLIHFPNPEEISTALCALPGHTRGRAKAGASGHYSSSCQHCRVPSKACGHCTCSPKTVLRLNQGPGPDGPCSA